MSEHFRYLRDDSRVWTSAGGGSEFRDETKQSGPLRGGPPEDFVVVGIDGPGGPWILRRPEPKDYRDGRVRPPGSGPALDECEVVEE